jgi:hypothetical protein
MQGGFMQGKKCSAWLVIGCMALRLSIASMGRVDTSFPIKFI